MLRRDLLKGWRYIGAFGPDLMLCAGTVRVGPLRQAFWAVWERDRGRLHERTTSVPGVVALPDGAVRVRSAGVEIDLRVEAAGVPVALTSPHGRGEIWTRKTPVRVVGTVRVDGRARAVDLRGLQDDSGGRHARVTRWCWAAGVGRDREGRAVVWNLVDGVHDAPASSERAVWVDGVAAPVGPVAFAQDLAAVRGSGVDLAFAAEATRERRENLGVVASDYVQPFGAVSGTLPGGIDLAEGFGVMERHRARW